jgi:hypothetical protein
MDEPTDWRDERPANIDRYVWRGAVALAAKRHPNASYPQPSDLADAETVVNAADRALACRPFTKKQEAEFLDRWQSTFRGTMSAGSTLSAGCGCSEFGPCPVHGGDARGAQAR